jgi:hypothetical protein
MSNLNNDQVKSNHGGSRANAGRPKGSITKPSWSSLLAEFDSLMGQSFVTTVVENYIMARTREDWSTVCVYDRAILNKLAPDLHRIEIAEDPDTIIAKQKAFEQALKDLKTLDEKQKLAQAVIKTPKIF